MKPGYMYSHDATLMQNIIKRLFPLNRALVASDTERALSIVSEYIPLKRFQIASGTKCFSWTVPKKWDIQRAVLSELDTGKIIADIQNNPLHIHIHSQPFRGIIDYEELIEHVRVDTNSTDRTPYVYTYYKKNWGFSMPLSKFKTLRKTKYKVHIEAKLTNGHMQIGEHTIQGRSKKEIVLIAHIDHPFQANDNLSGVAVLIDVARSMQKQSFHHTLKFLFLPETIGSIGYIWKRQKTLKKISAVLALDIVGNNNRFLIQGAFQKDHFINQFSSEVAKLAGYKYELAEYRQYIGSDEMVFSDPLLGNIPSVMLSTWPYSQYHTDKDTPEIIDSDTLNRTKNYVTDWVMYLDRNYVPIRKWKGPLMRTDIGWFLGKQPEDRQLELFGYMIDGQKSVLQLAVELNMNIKLALDYIETLEKLRLVERKIQI